MFRDAAKYADPSIWPTVALILFVVFFVGLIIWLYRPGQRSRMEPRKQIPLEEETTTSEGDARREQ